MCFVQIIRATKRKARKKSTVNGKKAQILGKKVQTKKKELAKLYANKENNLNSKTTTVNKS